MIRHLLPIAALLLGALIPPAAADESESQICLRAKVWDGYSDGWAVRSTTSTTLGPAEYRVYLMTLYKDNEYKIMACGDAAVDDVDVVIHGPQGQVLAQDAGESRQPEVRFVPPRTESYFVVVHAQHMAIEGSRAGVSTAITYR